MSQYTFLPCDLPPGTPVVASVRVSPGPHQDLDAQRSYIIEYCKHYDLRLIKIFEDRAKSGGSVVGRDGLVEMVRFVLNLPLDLVRAVIFYHTSRLARNMTDAQQVSAMLRQSGREVIYLQNPLPPGSVGQFVESAYLFADQQFREVLREQVVNGQLRIRSLKDDDGNYLGIYGGRTPFGFVQEKVDIGLTRNNGEKRILTTIKPDPALAPKIRRAFELRAEGMTYRQIENETGLLGWPENTYHNENVRYINLYKGIFARPIYKGVYEYKQKVYLKDGENGPPDVKLHQEEKINPLTGTPVRREYWINAFIYENYVEAIVTPELWDAAQKQRWVGNKREQAGTGTVEHIKAGAGELMILSGRLYCAHCGGLMYARAHKYKKTDAIYRKYYCSTCVKYGNDACTCPRPTVRGQDIEPAVIDYLFSTFLSPDFITSLTRRVNEILGGSDDQKDLTDLQAKIRDLARRRRNLLNLVSDGDADAEALYRDLTAQQQSKEAELAALLRGPDPFRPVNITAAEVNRSLLELRHGLEQRHISQKKAIVQRLLARIETGYEASEGRFANIHFDADNLLNVLGKGTGISNKWYCTMKQKFM